MLAQSLGGTGFYLVCAIVGLIVLGMAANEWLRLGSAKHWRIAIAGGAIFLGRLAGVAVVLLADSPRIIAFQEWVLESLALAFVVWAFLVADLATRRWSSRFLLAAAVSVGGILLASVLLGGRSVSTSVPPGPWLATLLLSLFALVLWLRDRLQQSHSRQFSVWMGGVFLVSSFSAVGGLLGTQQVAMLGHLAMLLLVAFEGYRAVLYDLGGLGGRFKASTKQAWQHTQEMAFLMAVGSSLSDSLDLRAVLERVSEAVARAVNADWAYVLIPESKDDEQLVVAARYGWWGRRWTQDNHPSRRVAIGSGELSLIRHAILRRHAVLVNEPGDYEQFECLHEAFARPQSGPALILPVTRQERTLGVVLLGRIDLSPRDDGLSDRQFTAADAQLCQALVVHIAAAIHNARLYQDSLEQSKQSAELLRQRDSETVRLHSILDSITDGVVLVTDTGKVALANAAAERILNVPRQHLLGRIITPLYAELLRDRECKPGDEALFEWDGKLLKSCLAPVRQPDGTLLGDVVVFRDISTGEHARRPGAERDAAVSRELQDLLSSARADTRLLAESAAEGATPLQQELLAQVAANIEQMLALLGGSATVSGEDGGGPQGEAKAVGVSTAKFP
ncbi:MAG: GAF domain-containing protein [Anaerolineae bacterium]|nr:GAF domain-containing protein [Anaerolineae bacterium]